MIDELGHETALPSRLGTNRAGLGELGEDLATGARQGKPSRPISSGSRSSILTSLRRSGRGRIRILGLGGVGLGCIPGCGLTGAAGNNPPETIINMSARVRQICTSF
jgi:hypothetical protein